LIGLRNGGKRVKVDEKIVFKDFKTKKKEIRKENENIFDVFL
jgi:hypothetical protein